VYTQCPECDVAFRITAEVLQQARGRVRCGSCGSAFNALDHLHEEPPDLTGGDEGDDPAKEARNKELLDTLNRLAGPDQVRIEDTGVEWLVLEESQDDEDDPLEGSWNVRDGKTDASGADTALDTSETAEQPVLDAQTALEFDAAPAEEMRYDDNTPLPDDFGADVDTPSMPTPQRRATDVGPPVATDETQVELELSEPDDWKDLLDEVGEAAAGNDASAGSDLSLEIEEELAAIHDELSSLPESLITKAAEAVEEITREELQLEVAEEPVAERAPEAAPATTEEPIAEKPPIEGSDGAEPGVAEAVGEEAVVEEAVNEEPAAREAIRDESIATTNAVAEDIDGDAELSVDDVLQLEDKDTARRSGERAAEDADPAEMLDADDLEALAEDTGSNEQLDNEQLDNEQIDNKQLDEDAAAAEIDPDAEQDAAAAEDETPSVEYEESTGEFERAIQSAENAIVSERADAERAAQEVAADDGADDEAGAASTEHSDDEASIVEQPVEELSIAEDDDVAAMTGNMKIDEEFLQAIKDKDLAAAMAGEDGAVVETIVMEGDAVRGILDIAADDDEPAETVDEPMPRQALKDPGSLVDTYMMNRADQDRRGWFTGKSGAALIALLALVLAVQYIHTSRETLATLGFFNQTIGPVYRMFGQPVTPRWDIKGWQFEATNGSTGTNDDVLTISSRISNRSEQPLPYPLVHVSLTDRYEEIIGSRVLEPNEYLAGSADPSRPVASGSNFTAVITIASPSAEATGFKLNVCYRVAPAQVRCAIEDFKAP